MCFTYLTSETRLIALERALAGLTETSLASPSMRRLAFAVADLSPASAAEDGEALRRGRLWRTLFTTPDRQPPTPAATVDAQVRFARRRVFAALDRELTDATAGARR